MPPQQSLQLITSATTSNASIIQENQFVLPDGFLNVDENYVYYVNDNNALQVLSS